MWIADNWKDYEVIDCSKGEKLERWGDYIDVYKRQIYTSEVTYTRKSKVDQTINELIHSFSS